MNTDVLGRARALLGTSAAVTLIDGVTHQGLLVRADRDAVELSDPVTMPATAKVLLVAEIVVDVEPA